ncbi:YfeK family protein [Thiobacillus sedimenti]|uniref:DUF5329 domain-containing protein n=1 Tax=Thiobacillus sedimenti TaxID=3110231 RepID=A0ABZ1CNP8_9PROT|nr:DUF5329 domain-containing protein [Thiobacillus sp. SCUT-2]WRS40628.1 DUF5329 domain-containing protein [Thiobacillus sp. SCUT-2]
MIKLAWLFPMTLLALSHAVFAASPGPETSAEIDSLLAYIGRSDCRFYRNGSWHDARTAEDHVRGKFLYFSARQEIHSTEDFIALAATKSSLSGRPYRVKCPGAPEQTSAAWLLGELHRERTMRSGEKPRARPSIQLDTPYPPEH